MSMGQNPYESPQVETSTALAARERQVSLLRGLLAALSLGAISYSLVYLSIVIANWLLTLCLTDYFVQIYAESLGTGIALMFALAGVIACTPAVRIGFTRALMESGLTCLAGLFVSATATWIFQLDEGRTYFTDPWAWLRITLAVSVPFLYAVVRTCRLCIQANG